MILPVIAKRRSVRSFLPKPISDEQIKEIIKAGQFAPSAKGNHAIEFLVIKDEKIKNQLGDLMGQPFVKEAPVLIIPFVETSETVAPIQDLSVCTQNIFLQATHMGLGTVWKNIHADNMEAVKKILNISEIYSVINLIPVGYPKIQPPPHSDKDFDEGKIIWEK